MRIEYISHACLDIRSAGDRIVTDPWWDGACYSRQWNVFPRPVDTSAAETADTVVISHAHADHLHEPTLRHFAAGKTAYYPFYWYGGVPDWLDDMGFARVVEARSGHPCQLEGGSRVTYLVCGQDAIVVVEDGESVLVNINDALHSAAQSTVDLYCRRIRELWPRIDYLFCGFGGASYYPNVFHSPDKDDRAIGRLREEYFVAAFCRVAAALEPDIAVPFAADFVLLNQRQRWMNEVRFPRERIPAYFDAHFRPAGNRTRILPMYPGDRLEGHKFRAFSPYREKLWNGTLDHLIDEQYPDEVSTFASGRAVDGPEADELVALLADHITGQAARLPWRKIEWLRFSVHVTDVATRNWYDVQLAERVARVSRVAEPDPNAEAHVHVSYDALVNSIKEDWGGDDIIIGYGCEVDAVSSAAMPRARIATELLVRHPDPGIHARRHPLRMGRYILQTWFASRARILAKLRRAPPANDMVKSGVWLTEDAGLLRGRLGLPSVAEGALDHRSQEFPAIAEVRSLSDSA